MFNYILSQYHLQEKDWLYSDTSPVQVGRHFELKGTSNNYQLIHLKMKLEKKHRKLSIVYCVFLYVTDAT